MQDERAKERELGDFEAQLAALAPRGEIDRDRLMFEAGVQAARRKLLVVNRLLGAACVLLAVTTVAPLAMRERAGEVAHAERKPADVKLAESTAMNAIEKTPEARELPDQLIVADSRELAIALAEGRSDLRPVRLCDVNEEKGGTVFRDETDVARPKSSRMLLREYLEAGGERL